MQIRTYLLKILKVPGFAVLDLGLKKANLMLIKLNNVQRCFVVVFDEYHFPAPALAYFAAVSSKGEKKGLLTLTHLGTIE
jgi:hypothetical protein